MLPISSYTIVLYAALLHLIQALILLGSRTADDSIGLHSLLAVIPDRRGLAAALIASPFASPVSVVLVASVLAAFPCEFAATAVSAPTASSTAAPAAIQIDRSIKKPSWFFEIPAC